ncbi:MAG TPA: hypothetical protein PLW31_05410 [Bacteroidales bacterium]|nr:hypothetical protein [Bacteroidales bacterium]HOX77458.1 hypothetical protein [Bacteroidales bacterium]HPI84788.1 hypothetical protein [Bacteroidales bacterium]
MSRVLYKEIQRFNQWWIWLIILLLSGFWIWQLVQQIFMGIPFGDNPAPDFVVILLGLFPLGALLLFRFMILETVIDEQGVKYRFKPFQRKPKLIKPEDVKTYEVKKYNPVMEFGGWGVRYGLKGTAYNVKGNMGAQFDLKNGKRFMLGTQNPDALRYALNKLFAKTDRQ